MPCQPLATGQRDANPWLAMVRVCLVVAVRQGGGRGSRLITSRNPQRSSAGWLGGWVAGWLGGWVAGWLGGWVAGWLDGWSAGWPLAVRSVPGDAERGKAQQITRPYGDGRTNEPLISRRVMGVSQSVPMIKLLSMIGTPRCVGRHPFQGKELDQGAGSRFRATHGVPNDLFGRSVLTSFRQRIKSRDQRGPGPAPAAAESSSLCGRPKREATSSSKA
jgi:hypothetical protein